MPGELFLSKKKNKNKKNKSVRRRKTAEETGGRQQPLDVVFKRKSSKRRGFGF